LTVLQNADVIRIKANTALDPAKKGSLGQFFTGAPICLFMGSLFNEIAGKVKLLDPGCGPGSLTAAFTDEALRRGNLNSLSIDVFDIEERIVPFVDETLGMCALEASEAGIEFDKSFKLVDYILKSANESGLFSEAKLYTHCIMNPPYKKISTSSDHRHALRAAGIETVNLYAGFVALGIQQLQEGGELVAIIPRSFCNGPYYQAFRGLILKETAIKHIHIFDSRSNAFSEDEVLQENIIIHLVKSEQQGHVTITSSPVADFHIDEESGTVTASDMTTRKVAFDRIVNQHDKEKFIHIAANERDQTIIDRLGLFTLTLDDLKIQVSTGPVVDFRLKDDLRQDIEEGAVPLIYPVHLNGGVNWPKDSKKPNAISISDQSRSWLWKHEGHFVIVRRFSSKEEKRRIVATPYDSSLPGKLIGFENKLNVFHAKKVGFDKEQALGLYVYLNSTLLDKYYRLFGGHTQVNATDLRNIHYPTVESLRRIGAQVESTDLTQKQIDELLDREFFDMTGNNNNNPLKTQEKLEQALEILTFLGMPRAQQNERSALTFLALLNLQPEGSWQDIEKPLLGVTPIMDWAKNLYGKEYAPNTRENFRRQTLHQFVDGGLALYNPDKLDRPVNSPKACYQITSELFDVLTTYGTDEWEQSVSDWLAKRQTLTAQYAAKREMQMIPLTLDDGTEIKLSPGVHSQLIHDIVVEFGPRFAPGSEVIYLGDTGAKEDFFKKARLAEFGVTVDRKGKLPDVVLYWPDKGWLLLIESVTSHGPVDGKRHKELSTLFSKAKPGLVYVTAFPDRKTMGKYLGVISWETEVWVAEAPTHMIHFNGDRFLGPH
jgi:adenine-specific DNA-methyltransferase